MLRLRLPGGRMTPSQWLAAETLSDQFGNGTLKLTTRQAIQIHGVVKQDLKQTMKDIHHAAITTIAASGGRHAQCHGFSAPGRFRHP